jgi:hypothetical protein
MEPKDGNFADKRSLEHIRCGAAGEKIALHKRLVNLAFLRFDLWSSDRKGPFRSKMVET